MYVFILKVALNFWPRYILVDKEEFAIFKIKNRYKIALEALNIRGKNETELALEFKRVVIGNHGEQLVLNKILNNLKLEPLFLQDYLFEVNDMECQIDLLLIFQNECVLVEVKNYAGLYRVENKEMYFLSSGERLVKSPFNQVERAKMLLTQLFKEEGIRLSINEKIVFPNEEFYLYGDDVSMPTVYSATFPYFLKQLNQKRCALGDYHQGIYEKLMRRRLVKSKYDQPIVVEYDTLAKGITCKCGGWMKSTTRMKVLCETCGAHENNESAIMRMTEHFIAVFPDRTLTATEIYYWVDGEISKRTITRILGRNFDSKGTTRGRHFLYEE